MLDMSTSSTPAELGYRWPAEWERQASVWLSWPRNPATWPDHFEPVPEEFAQFVRLLAQYEPVNILAGGREVLAQARSLVGDLVNVNLYDIPTNDAWCRDHGPTFLSRPLTPSGPEVPNSVLLSSLVGAAAPVARPVPHGVSGLPNALIDWDYNAWGGKYPPFDLDNQVPRRIADLQGRRVFSPGIILEGGAIDGNGRGTILTTESCLLNPNRNPQLGKADVEQVPAGLPVRQEHPLAQRRRNCRRRHRRPYRPDRPVCEPDHRCRLALRRSR